MINTFFEERERIEGLIPVALQPENELVVWQDLGQYHFYEGFFHKSLAAYMALNKTVPISKVTEVNVFEYDDVSSHAIYPTGFIFHAGRSGSTLLMKALARSRENLIISEPDVLNLIWALFTKNGAEPLEITDKHKKIYRNLVLAFARKRLESHQRCFFKFSSYNIRFFEFINAVFPYVPKLFISRDTDKIVASFQKKQPEWLAQKNDKILKLFTGYDSPDLAGIIEGFKQCASQQLPDVLKHLDYSMINKDNLTAIFSYFDYKPSEKELGLMQMQFAYDSKVEFNGKRFE